jgi:hypothetical protein
MAHGGRRDGRTQRRAASSEQMGGPQSGNYPCGDTRDQDDDGMGGCPGTAGAGGGRRIHAGAGSRSRHARSGSAPQHRRRSRGNVWSYRCAAENAHRAHHRRRPSDLGPAAGGRARSGRGDRARATSTPPCWPMPTRSVSRSSTARISAETSQRLACDASRVVMRHDADGNITAVRPGPSHPTLGARRPHDPLESRDACRRHHRAVHERARD